MAAQSDLDRMNSELAALNDSLARARSSISWATAGAWLIGASSSADANQALLVQMEGEIGKLSGVWYMDVVAGNRTVESWESWAAYVHKTIQSVDTDLPNWSFSGVAAATASQTAQDVKKDATIGLAIGAPILLAAGALYLVLLFRPLRG